MKNLMMIGSVIALSLCLTGCVGFRPYPSWNRCGDFYETTRGYLEYQYEYGEDFVFIGKAMVQGGFGIGQAAMVAIPMPSLFVGCVLAIVEDVTICPVVDTLMLPRDIYVRCTKSEEERDAIRAKLHHDEERRRREKSRRQMGL